MAYGQVTADFLMLRWPIVWKDRRLSIVSVDHLFILSKVGLPALANLASLVLIRTADMRLFTKSILKEEPWKYDSKVIPMPWRQDQEDHIKSKLNSGGLTLGFFNCDGVVGDHRCPLRIPDSLSPSGSSSPSHPPRC